MNHNINTETVKELLTLIEMPAGSTERFEGICGYVSSHGPEDIISTSAYSMGIAFDELASRPMGGYRRLVKDDGTFDRGNGCYFYTLSDLMLHLGEYKKTYNRLADDASRTVYTNLLLFRILPAVDFLQAAYEASAEYPQYFDEEIVKYAKGEVFADCGGYIGDTAQEFIKHCNEYKHIYVYEPMADNYKKCREALGGLRDITIRNAGVGAKSFKAALSGGGSDSSGSLSALAGSEANDDSLAEVVSLDEDITEPVTFIKMDVECFEPEAIRGASGHIRESSPKLAVCLYHMVSDIWEIPKLIDEINPGYNFYLRHYQPDQNIEYVLYAI